MATRNRLVAVGLLTAANLKLLGSDVRHAFPLDEGNVDFADLLSAIDDADHHYRAGLDDVGQ